MNSTLFGRPLEIIRRLLNHIFTVYMLNNIGGVLNAQNHKYNKHEVRFRVKTDAGLNF